MSRPKILLVTNRFHPQVGGAEIVVFNQAQELAKHFEVHVYTPRRDNDPRRERVGNIAIIRGLDVRNLFRPFPHRAAETLCPGLFFRILFGNYRLVHGFPAMSHNNMLAAIAAKIRRLPVFLTNFDLIDYVAELKRGRDLGAILNGLELPTRQQRFLRRLNAIFTISNREADLLKTVNPNTYVSTVPVTIGEFNGNVEPEAFRARYNIPPDAPLILCLGRVSPIKGQDVLLKALPKLKERIPNVRALAIGSTEFEPEYYEGLKSFIEEHNLQEHVTFTGGVPRADVIAALYACDVHVLPVRFMNSGAVVVETWAAAKPVLHSDGVDPCYVVEGENGYTFKSEDPAGLCDALVKLLENPDQRTKMGANGRKLVEEKFLYAHVVQQYRDTYASLGGVGAK